MHSLFVIIIIHYIIYNLINILVNIILFYCTLYPTHNKYVCSRVENKYYIFSNIVLC